MLDLSQEKFIAEMQNAEIR